jgi:AcrR family transcriptional regulator
METNNTKSVSSMSPDGDMEVRKRVIEAAREEFYKFGFSKVTVDEIASKLGMSKKTIYKYFPSKDDLVHIVTQETMNEMELTCSNIVKREDVDFVDKLREMMTHVAIQYSKMGVFLLEDLQKNVPQVWKEIDEFRRKRIYADFGKLLREGMQKGMFRNDIDEQLILLIYANAVQTIIAPEVLVNLPFSAVQVFEAIMKIMYEGLLTDEAKSKYLSRQSLLSVAQQRI